MKKKWAVTAALLLLLSPFILMGISESVGKFNLIMANEIRAKGSTLTLAEDAIALTGATTLTGNLTQVGNTSATGNLTQTGNVDYTGSMTADSGVTTYSGWTAGGAGVLLVNSCAAWYSAVNSTQSTYTLTTQDSAFAAGDVLKIEVSGTVVGANAATQLQLMFGTTAVCQLDKAAGAGDFTAEFTICEHTDFANQEVYGFLKSSAAADGDADHTAQTTDFSDPVSIGLDITSGHGSDTITIHSIAIWLYRKN